MGKSCGEQKNISLGGQYYGLGQSSDQESVFDQGFGWAKEGKKTNADQRQGNSLAMWNCKQA